MPFVCILHLDSSAVSGVFLRIWPVAYGSKLPISMESFFMSWCIPYFVHLSCLLRTFANLQGRGWRWWESLSCGMKGTATSCMFLLEWILPSTHLFLKCCWNSSFFRCFFQRNFTFFLTGDWKILMHFQIGLIFCV